MVVRGIFHRMRTLALEIILALSVGACGRHQPSPPPAPARQSAESPLGAAQLRAAAAQAFVQGRFDECADLYQRAATADELSRHDRYHAARCLASTGKADPSFALLAEVIAGGFTEADRLETDPAFVRLRGSAAWPSLVAGARANRERLSRSNPELAQIYAADQADRRLPGDQWMGVPKRDEERRLRVNEIMVNEGLGSAADHFHAAMVFQHGDVVEDYRLAHWLALRAAKMAPTYRPARWLAAASKDRELIALGQPQLYGTQFGGAGERSATATSVTDQERIRWAVPPLAGKEPDWGNEDVGDEW
jgi:hypothetical protein